MARPSRSVPLAGCRPTQSLLWWARDGRIPWSTTRATQGTDRRPRAHSDSAHRGRQSLPPVNIASGQAGQDVRSTLGLQGATRPLSAALHPGPGPHRNWVALDPDLIDLTCHHRSGSGRIGGETSAHRVGGPFRRAGNAPGLPGGSESQTTGHQYPVSGTASVEPSWSRGSMPIWSPVRKRGSARRKLSGIVCIVSFAGKSAEETKQLCSRAWYPGYNGRSRRISQRTGVRRP